MVASRGRGGRPTGCPSRSRAGRTARPARPAGGPAGTSRPKLAAARVVEAVERSGLGRLAREVDGLGRARPACGRPARRWRSGRRAACRRRGGSAWRRLSSAIRSSLARCWRSATPVGGSRWRIGAPSLRNGVPWKVAGMKPLPQLRGPPTGSAGVGHHDEGGQVLVLGPQAVASPTPPATAGPPGSLPVFIWQTLPTWFMPSAQHDRITREVVDAPRRCAGYQSETHVPALAVLLRTCGGWPAACCRRPPIGVIDRAEARRAAACRRACPARAWGRTGRCGSGPPSMNRKMQRSWPSPRVPRLRGASRGTTGVASPGRLAPRVLLGQQVAEGQAAEPPSGPKSQARRSGDATWWASLGARPGSAHGFMAALNRRRRTRWKFRSAWQKSTSAAPCAGT